MLEEKIKVRRAMENKESKKRVKKLFIDYVNAYQKLHKPSEHHIQQYKNMFFKFIEYMNRKDIPNGGFW